MVSILSGLIPVLSEGSQPHSCKTSAVDWVHICLAYESMEYYRKTVAPILEVGFDLTRPLSLSFQYSKMKCCFPGLIGWI